MKSGVFHLSTIGRTERENVSDKRIRYLTVRRIMLIDIN